MTTKTLCDFCGKDAGCRECGKITVIPNTGGQRSYDACAPCMKILDRRFSGDDSRKRIIGQLEKDEDR